jgi:murein DD-endopeptidase MepM/ murein hydrolase activator NlpD
LKKKNTKSFWHRIRFKYKLSFINEGTLEEVWSFRLSQLSAFVTLAVFAFFLIAVTAFIIIKTPIRNYLPGYLDVEVRKEIMQNALRADSLERMIEIQSLYLDNVAGIISGTMPLDSIRQIDSLASNDINYEIPRSKEETRFVKDYEEEEKYNLSVLTDPGKVPTEGVFFYKPVNGVVTSHYETDVHHYGVDLAAAPKESVLATLDGTVIYTGFDPNHGNVIQLQHKNGFISVYKHNELLLKEVGDHVVAGEAMALSSALKKPFTPRLARSAIALVGNTGELSTGPHLHFELWYKGNPVNPEEYIAF